MALDGGALARACGAAPEGGIADELCRADLGRFHEAVGRSAEVLVTCTQEAPAFQHALADRGGAAALDFVNIREAAGWSSEAAGALPKMAALIIGATLRSSAAPEVAMRSEGVTVVYGRDDRAIEAAAQLRDRLDLTVIITGEAALTPPRVAEFPVVRGTIRRVTGHLGAFDLVVDGFAEALPSSRAVLAFGRARDNARSRCDLILDLTGDGALLPGHEHRDGYLRASPDDPVSVQRMLFAAADLVGEFSKPRYATLAAGKCAHARSGQVGCTRCLDVCPTSAIAPAGESVALDPHVCAGCGACAAVCPTTAISYTSPGAEATAVWLRQVLTAYREAGGTAPPVLLMHDAAGLAVIETLARQGDGLPARVIPVAMAGQFGLDAFATALAFGAAELVVLASARDRARQAAVEREVALVEALCVSLGYGAGRLRLVATDDPFGLAEALAGLPVRAGAAPAVYWPMGDKIALTMQALNALQKAAPAAVEAVALPAGAPIGAIAVDAAGCTLCLACVSACPTSALRDNDERPMLKFVEDNCVQCGLCQTICPEDVITLVPRATFGVERRTERVLKQEEPALCIRCAKPFGTRASVEKIVAQLAGRHWMFSDPAVADRIRMCGDCRVVAQTRQGIDPYAGPARPATRTTDDYR